MQHPSVTAILRHFTYEHLPEHLAIVSAPFCELAQAIAGRLEGPELTVALRKLLEAKDAAVRARIDSERPAEPAPEPVEAMTHADLEQHDRVVDVSTVAGLAGPLVIEHATRGGNPTGGSARGVGIVIDWQEGPRGNPDGTLAPASGAFVEDVIALAVDRLRFFQRSRFECDENEAAIELLDRALHELDKRRHDRSLRGVEGTYEE